VILAIVVVVEVAVSIPAI